MMRLMHTPITCDTLALKPHLPQLPDLGSLLLQSGLPLCLYYDAAMSGML